MILTAHITMRDNSTIHVPFDANSISSAAEVSSDRDNWLQFGNVFVFPGSARAITYSDSSAEFGGAVA